MTATEELAKDYEDNNLERRGAVNLWGRSWKPDLVIRLKDEHTGLSDHFAAQIKALPEPGSVDVEEYESALRALDASSRVLDRIRERMCRMALHPTCPKADQSARGGGRPRKGAGPIHDAELVSPPVTPDPAP